VVYVVHFCALKKERKRPPIVIQGQNIIRGIAKRMVFTISSPLSFLPQKKTTKKTAPKATTHASICISLLLCTVQRRSWEV